MAQQPNSPVTIPEILPCMVLSETVLFPATVLPLYVFEHRYRRMLAEVLQGNGVFGVTSTVQSPDQDIFAWGNPAPVATAGIIKACQTNPDGTSNLLIEGLTRVATVGWASCEDYPCVQVKPIRTLPLSAAAADRLRIHVMRILEAIHKEGDSTTREVIQYVHSVTDPEVFADTVAFVFVSEWEIKQSILECRELRERFQILIAHFQKELYQVKWKRKLRHDLSQNELQRN